MGLLHISIPADRPEHVATVLARILGGPALPFPPCPGAWIAFSAADDGTAIEVYPVGTEISAGAEAIAFHRGASGGGPSPCHGAIASDLGAQDLIALGEAEGWRARICNRGPFDCVELWIENRFLVEVLTPEMQNDYRRGMTAACWRAMFGMEDGE